MMTNKELIDYAKSLDCRKDYGSLFEFAKNYLMNPNIADDEKSRSLFATIKFFMDNPRSDTTAFALGKRGRYFESVIKDWCRMMLGDKDLRGLSANELHYVMGYCVRLSKIQSAGI